MADTIISHRPSMCHEPPHASHQLRCALSDLDSEFRTIQAAHILLGEIVEKESGCWPLRIEVVYDALDGRLARMSDALDKLVDLAGGAA